MKDSRLLNLYAAIAIAFAGLLWSGITKQYIVTIILILLMLYLINRLYVIRNKLTFSDVLDNIKSASLDEMDIVANIKCETPPHDDEFSDKSVSCRIGSLDRNGNFIFHEKTARYDFKSKRWLTDNGEQIAATHWAVLKNMTHQNLGFSDE